MDNREGNNVKTISISLYGIVQGVGFRPFVAKLADHYAIKGRIKNQGGYVKIIATASDKALELFKEALMHDKPIASEIIHHTACDIDYIPYTEFTIEESEEGKEELIMLPPDLPVCEDCLKEMHTAENKRYTHSFISCIACGPRYSIIDTIPYDRKNTAMIDFEMCENCKEEYTSRQDRRYHAQTTSCLECGPYLIYNNALNQSFTHEQALKEAAKDLRDNKLLAVKGIGGYHFVCSPFNTEAVLKLRELKLRDEKPFAVMFPSLEVLENYCEVSEKEKLLLTSVATPIVLLERKPSAICEDVYKKSRYLGAFLPYTPFHHQLMALCGPLVMTSANLSDRPMIKDEEEMFSFMDKGLEGILYHTRAIRERLDDSVARIVGDEVQLIRRARGYVPLPIYIKGLKVQPNSTLLAAGGQLKNTFCLSKGNFAYMSQHLGELEDIKSIECYEESYHHMKALFHIEPTGVICDSHPNYFTTSFANKHGLPLLKVQHHHAHIASVMAEHNLKKVIGIAFDGTGYGTDDAIWGGEFLICEGKDFTRRAHLDYMKLLGGDSSIKDNQKTATCYLLQAGLEESVTDKRKPIITAALKSSIPTFSTSSMGRLFDCVSSILNLCDYSHYEGEGAILLENAAATAIKENISPVKMSFEFQTADEVIKIDIKPILNALIQGITQKQAITALALGFHIAVSDMVLKAVNLISQKENIQDIALSGGVFQNAILLQRCKMLLTNRGYNVYTNTKVPTNDGGLALGQIYIGMQHFNHSD